MSKSILIIGTQDNCNKCPLFTISQETLDVFCVGFIGKRKKIKGVYDPRGVQKPDWCPLKEVPEKYYPVGMNFERGWNACIDEILKESDGNA